MKCHNCNKRFNKKQKEQIFCSSNCRKRFWDKKKVIELLISILQESLGKLEDCLIKGGNDELPGNEKQK